MVNCVSSTSIQIRFKKVLTVFEGESSHCPMPPCKTTKLQIRASEEMCPSYRCGIEKTSSQMRTPDHQGGSNRLFSQKYRQWLQRKSTCCSTSLVRYILFSLDWWSAYRDVVVSVKHLCIKQNKVFLIYIVEIISPFLDGSPSSSMSPIIATFLPGRSSMGDGASWSPERAALIDKGQAL